MEEPIDILIEWIKQFICNYEHLKGKSKYLYEENQKLNTKIHEVKDFLKEVKSVKNYYSENTHNFDIFEYKKKRIEL